MTLAVVLAAGASTRMGAPKALVPYDGVPALLRIERACLEAGAERVLAVVGAHEREIRDALGQRLHATTRLLAHPEWARGRTGSLQRALAETRPERALVWPVDHPLATAATARALLAAHGDWVAPTFGGKPGHPIVLGADAIARVLAADPGAPLRALRLATTLVEVDDEGVLLNLDTPSTRASLERGI